MRLLKPHSVAPGLHGFLVAAATVYAASAAWAWREALIRDPGLSLLLAAGAVTAAWVSRRDRSGRSPRFASTFVLSAFALLPPPAGMLVALAAACAARGAGVAGLYRGGAAVVAPLLSALALGQALSATWFAAALGPSSTLLGLTLAFLTVQFVAFGVARLLGVVESETAVAGARMRWRPAVAELLNVLLAWLLVAAIAHGAWLQALGVSGLALFLGWSLSRLGHALHQLQRTGDALALRHGELETLHAIGREILSTPDPKRVLAIIGRECGKIFDVNICTIALRDPETSALEAVFVRRHGQAAERKPRTLARGLATEVAASRRALRVDDRCALPPDRSFQGESLAPETRSAIAVPLIVEERVTGVIVLESDAVSAYDDHQLSVLTTIAQQAAVAIENARNYRLATVDSLTGFYSRDPFFRRLEEEHTRVRRYGGEFALLMLDLDGFKAINDRHGHQAGDRYLRGIAQTVREQLRDADLPCRYGGDEFCVLLPETSLAGAQIIGERIRDAVSARVLASDGQVLRTTISVGVAAFPEHDSGQFSGLVRNADEALYRAKRAGRNCVVPFAA